MWWWRDSGSIRNFGFAPKPAVGARNADSPVVGQSVLTFWHEIQDFCGHWPPHHSYRGFDFLATLPAGTGGIAQNIRRKPIFLPCRVQKENSRPRDARGSIKHAIRIRHAAAAARAGRPGIGRIAMPELNIAHSEYKLQQGGLMICGYEWGDSIQDQEADAQGKYQPADTDVACTFANKELQHGDRALKWRYDATIMKWFGIWGHPLNKSNPSDFEKSVIQTNWCNTQNHSIGGNYSKLNDNEHVKNFLYHVNYFEPSVILFMGSELIKAFQNHETLDKFQLIMGKCTRPPVIMQKPFTGRQFKVTFQSFEKCEVVCLPHPSSSHGLSNDYIKLFAGEMDTTLECFKRKHFSSKSM